MLWPFLYLVLFTPLLLSVPTFSEFKSSIIRFVPIISRRENRHPVSSQQQAQVEFIPLCADSSHANNAVSFYSQCKPCHDYLIAYDIVEGIGTEEFLPESQCKSECCAEYSLEAISTGHFISCYKGCCSRIVSLQTSGTETPQLSQFIIETQTVVVNEVTVRLSPPAKTDPDSGLPKPFCFPNALMWMFFLANCHQ